jgi:hypothetical protein
MYNRTRNERGRQYRLTGNFRTSGSGLDFLKPWWAGDTAVSLMELEEISNSQGRGANPQTYLNSARVERMKRTNLANAEETHGGLSTVAALTSAALSGKLLVGGLLRDIGLDLRNQVLAIGEARIPKYSHYSLSVLAETEGNPALFCVLGVIGEVGSTLSTPFDHTGCLDTNALGNLAASDRYKAFRSPWFACIKQTYIRPSDDEKIYQKMINFEITRFANQYTREYVESLMENEVHRPAYLYLVCLKGGDDWSASADGFTNITMHVSNFAGN